MVIAYHQMILVRREKVAAGVVVEELRRIEIG